ncbi:LOW QUALITY PROTEIN: hypothetical protein PHMEG_00028508 [Phytophthora megakarya]|uniref:Uncharacterized protein n=1 Tax=Phytophthora megakarya TaxID=4795 RepID=A0A225V6B7_9STRA|nr:LOW QUALITY PROTEIN: hypothetical protein PHMEG_00028508 [Phytophthora megakarya]
MCRNFTELPESPDDASVILSRIEVQAMSGYIGFGPACDIPEAVEWLLFKDMHRPVEEEDEFSVNAKWTELRIGR